VFDRPPHDWRWLARLHIVGAGKIMGRREISAMLNWQLD
jgi:hypothetical protein